MDVLQRILNPYWSKDPYACHWTDHIGPAGFLQVKDMVQFPNVGLHNLCWLMLDTDFKRKRSPGDKAIMDKVIFELQHAACGKAPLGTVAALTELPHFHTLVTHASFSDVEWVRFMCNRKLGIHEPI